MSGADACISQLQFVRSFLLPFTAALIRSEPDSHSARANGRFFFVHATYRHRLSDDHRARSEAYTWRPRIRRRTIRCE